MFMKDHVILQQVSKRRVKQAHLTITFGKLLYLFTSIFNLTCQVFVVKQEKSEIGFLTLPYMYSIDYKPAVLRFGHFHPQTSNMFKAIGGIIQST